MQHSKENFSELCLNGYTSIKLFKLKNEDIAPVSSKELLDIQATIQCRFALKCVRAMIITYNTLQHSYKVQSTKKVI